MISRPSANRPELRQTRSAAGRSSAGPASATAMGSRLADSAAEPGKDTRPSNMSHPPPKAEVRPIEPYRFRPAGEQHGPIEGVLQPHPARDGSHARAAAGRPAARADHRSLRQARRQARPQRTLHLRLRPQMEKCHGAPASQAGAAWPATGEAGAGGGDLNLVGATGFEPVTSRL